MVELIIIGIFVFQLLVLHFFFKGKTFGNVREEDKLINVIDRFLTTRNIRFEFVEMCEKRDNDNNKNNDKDIVIRLYRTPIIIRQYR